MNGGHQKNIVGVFADERAAHTAVRSLEQAGLPPGDIAVIEGDVRQAREVAGSRSPQGAAVGGLAGLAVFGAFVAMGGPVLVSSLAVVALGLVGFVLPGVAIGALAGRARVFVADRGARYEDAVEAGKTLVAVHVDEPGRDRVRRLLREAGAITLREEGTVEAA